MTRSRAALRALKEEVLGEVRDAAGVGVLVARADGVHDHHAGRLRIGLCGGQQAGSVGEMLEFEHVRTVVHYRLSRASTRLPLHDRLRRPPHDAPRVGDRVVLFKEDGSVAVHALKGAKPINYMAGPTSVREEDDVIRIYRPASDETLTIVVEQVHRDERHALVDEALLEREGQERELHEHLARAPHLIEPGLAVVERERLTDVGPVDLWCRDAEGRVALVEVKRVRAVAAAVEQVVRYREQAQRNAALGEIRALVVAPDFAPQAKVLAGRAAWSASCSTCPGCWPRPGRTTSRSSEPAWSLSGDAQARAPPRAPARRTPRAPAAGPRAARARRGA